MKELLIVPPRVYLDQESVFCKKETDAFYACEKPNGDSEKEHLRERCLKKREEFKQCFKYNKAIIR